MTTTKQIRDALSTIVDTVGKNKAGNFVVRRGFFYTGGVTADKVKQGVTGALQKAGMTVEVVDHGEVWKSFRGGATVAQGSHWYVEFKVK